MQNLRQLVYCARAGHRGQPNTEGAHSLSRATGRRPNYSSAFISVDDRRAIKKSSKFLPRYRTPQPAFTTQPATHPFFPQPTPIRLHLTQPTLSAPTTANLYHPLLNFANTRRLQPNAFRLSAQPRAFFFSPFTSPPQCCAPPVLSDEQTSTSIFAVTSTKTPAVIISDSPLVSPTRASVWI